MPRYRLGAEVSARVVPIASGETALTVREWRPRRPAWVLRKRNASMLRISVANEPDGTTVTLEGRVVGAWVDELGTCWRRLLPSAARPIRVDLDGVMFVDAAGRSLLRAMRTDGASFSATTLVMRAVIEEITATETSTAAREPHRAR